MRGDRGRWGDALFARHSNPLSAWSRWATTPLLLVPFWTRRRGVALLVALWFAVNPVMTPPPRRRSAFATRAMLGEKLWADDHARDPRMTLVNGLGSVALITAIAGARRRRGAVAALGVVANLATTMYSWQRYAALYDAEHSASDAA